MVCSRLARKAGTLFPFFLLLLTLTMSLPHTACALASAAQSDAELGVRLVSGQNTLGNAKEILLGLDVALDDGVHTYWRSPGMAGTPPSLDWTGSDNLAGATLLYPAPTRFTLQGLDTIGYQGRVLFPIRAQVLDTAKPLSLKLGLDLLVCKELCLPKHFDLALMVPAGVATPSNETAQLEQALRLVPSSHATPSLAITDMTRTENKIYISLASDSDLVAPDLFVESKDGLVFLKPDITFDSTHRKATLVAELDGKMPEGHSLTQTPLTVTVVDGEKAIEQQLAHDGPVALPQGQDAPQTTAPALWHMILFALIGGLILNLMPCVLPVLSLKIFSVMKHGGNGHDHIRQSFIATASGVIVSFLLLGSATVLLKQGGTAIGWGVQFQQPTFLVFMITLLTLFTANLWGFFEVALPRFIMDRINTAHHPKLAGDFATGMLATLLATPCSAPFLGTAVGFALAAGPLEIYSIFLALGLGMAIPYILIAIYPALAGSLPKPGHWMTTLTRLLGFGMAATAVWLLLVLHEQIGKQLTALISAGMLAILAQLFLRHKNILRFLTIPVILLVFAGSFLIGLAATVPESVSHKAGVWTQFDEGALDRAVRDGKVVFVDITADWCITCKANKRFTLSRDDVTKKLFNNDKVVAMQGDWTNPDPVLTAFLHKHGRYGIPFNAVFGPKAPEGILLPELLTPSAVLDAIDHAKGVACPVDWPAGKAC